MRRSKNRVLAADVTIRSRTTGRFKGSAVDVWDRIEAPETQMLMDPEIVLTGRLPGTPRGIGEIQYYVFAKDGRRCLSALEIVDYEYGKRAVTQTISHLHELELAARTTTLLEDLEDGHVRLTHEWSVTLPEGTDALAAQGFQVHADEFAERTAIQVRRVFG